MMLIDPPVGPFSPPADVAAWLADLRALLATHGELPEIREAIATAEGWLGKANPA